MCGVYMCVYMCMYLYVYLCICIILLSSNSILSAYALLSLIFIAYFSFMNIFEMLGRKIIFLDHQCKKINK